MPKREQLPLIATEAEQLIDLIVGEEGQLTQLLLMQRIELQRCESQPLIEGIELCRFVLLQRAEGLLPLDPSAPSLHPEEAIPRHTERWEGVHRGHRGLRKARIRKGKREQQHEDELRRKGDYGLHR